VTCPEESNNKPERAREGTLDKSQWELELGGVAAGNTAQSLEDAGLRSSSPCFSLHLYSAFNSTRTQGQENSKVNHLGLRASQEGQSGWWGQEGVQGKARVALGVLRDIQ
jgi:hypothetical protein